MSYYRRGVHLGDMRSAYKMLVRKPEGKIPHGGCRRRRDNIRMDLT
jgi:hypothetical protein